MIGNPDIPTRVIPIVQGLYSWVLSLFFLLYLPQDVRTGEQSLQCVCVLLYILIIKQNIDDHSAAGNLK